MFSADGNRVFCSDSHGNFQIWDWKEDEKLLFQQKIDSKPISNLQWMKGAKLDEEGPFIAANCFDNCNILFSN